MEQKQRLRIDGMHCASCAMTIDDALEELDGVSRSKTSLRKERTDVVFDDEAIDLASIRHAVADLGYRAE